MDTLRNIRSNNENEYRAKIRAKSTSQVSWKVSNIQAIQEINESLYSKLNKNVVNH